MIGMNNLGTAFIQDEWKAVLAQLADNDPGGVYDYLPHLPRDDDAVSAAGSGAAIVILVCRIV